MRVSVWVVPSDVLSSDPDSEADSNSVELVASLPLLVAVEVGPLVTAPVVLLESLLPEVDVGVGVGVGVGAGLSLPSGVVKGSSLAKKLEHTAWPALMAAPRSVGFVHAVKMQPPTFSAMAVCVGPHWQPMSLRAQPAAVMAEDRHGSLREKFNKTWAICV